MNETGIEDLDNTNQPAEMKFDSPRLLRFIAISYVPAVGKSHSRPLLQEHSGSRRRHFNEDNGQWIFMKSQWTKCPLVR